MNRLAGTALAAALILCSAAPARAETATFLPTGAEQIFTVPAGVTSIHVIAVGGRGGADPLGGSVGGYGAVVSADLPVTPGQVLYVQVGANGGDGSLVPSFNGGGAGGDATSGGDGGAGGGASDVRTAPRAAGSSLLTRLITAAGGGGGGSGTSLEGDGGAAGAPGGEGPSGSNSPGQPGTETAGGSGGNPTSTCRGEDGGLGTGGAGGRPACVGVGAGAGGGGGGGIYGGGGGAASSSGAGGGGGSSGFGPSAVNTTVAIDNTASPSISISYTAPPSDGGGNPPPAPDTTAPTGASLTMLPSAFRPLGRGGAVAPGAARGTRVSYTLSEAASVRFTVARALPGRRVGRRCVRPTRANAKRRHCTRFRTVSGSFTRAVRPAGTDAFRFSGRLRGRALRPGRYRMTGVPTDVAGNRGRRFSARFTILRR
jgi:Glycine rich protein